MAPVETRGAKRAALMALAAALAAALALAGAPSASARPNYVALGDSFTAGPLIPMQIPPYGCLKSDRNYPHLASYSFTRLVLRDASCSGAKTTHMKSPQDVDPGPNPPQFNRLSRDTRLVTLGIGGNDIGFSEIIRNCRSNTPEGQPCQDHYVRDGRDIIAERIADTAPKVAAVLRGIRKRSPRAAVYVVNYLPILPERGDGCWPQMPVARADVPYLRRKHKQLNRMLAQQARANGARVIDAYTAGIGHDACKLPLVRWVEPAVPASAAAPFHPNLQGMQATKRVMLARVGRR